MCIFPSQKMDDPKLPPEYAAQRNPDGAVARDTAGRRAGDQARSGVSTILTSQSGVTNAAMTDKKTLLGQ